MKKSMIDTIPKPEIKQIRQKVEEALERYRLYKYLCLEKREASNTSMRDMYCDLIERLVSNLPEQERRLIEIRYMSSDSQYITDQNVYGHKFDPPISQTKYDKIRTRAMYKIGEYLKYYEGKKLKAE